MSQNNGHVCLSSQNQTYETGLGLDAVNDEKETDCGHWGRLCRVDGDAATVEKDERGAGNDHIGQGRRDVWRTGAFSPVGGAPAGIEAATQLAEQQPELWVTLLSDGSFRQMLAVDGRPFTVIGWVGQNGRFAQIYAITNPAKLGRIR